MTGKASRRLRFLGQYDGDGVSKARVPVWEAGRYQASAPSVVETSAQGGCPPRRPAPGRSTGPSGDCSCVLPLLRPPGVGQNLTAHGPAFPLALGPPPLPLR